MKIANGFPFLHALRDNNSSLRVVGLYDVLVEFVTIHMPPSIIVGLNPRFGDRAGSGPFLNRHLHTVG
jgi:hypothetical protein